MDAQKQDIALDHAPHTRVLGRKCTAHTEVHGLAVRVAEQPKAGALPSDASAQLAERWLKTYFTHKH